MIEYSIVGEDCVIEEYATVGARPETISDKSEWGVAVVGHNVTVSEGAKVLPKQIISENI